MSIPDFQVIATTATLRDPTGHLHELTGMDFVEIGETDNGAPSYGVSVLHLEGPESGAPAERAATELVEQILANKPTGTCVIAFMDSRQGVERLVRNIGSTSFLPYRQGYIREDRQAIEQALRDGRVDGVGSTSALEAGIHLPQFVYGIAVNVPASRKSLRQRCGRIGRTQAGVFVILAPRTAFAKLGTTLAASVHGLVEPSPLYLGNRHIQMQQASCYRLEAVWERGEPLLEADLAWPEDFARFVALAEPGARRPLDLEDTARMGLNNPHRTFGMRSMPTVSYVLKDSRCGDAVGTIDQQKALREAGPGMTYLHRGRAYRVVDWRSSPYDNAILVQPQKDAPRTQAIMRCQVGASLEVAALIEHHYLSGDTGNLFEAQLRVVESTEGYRIGSTALLYRDLHQTDRRLSRKQREFMTTGVVIQIDEPWFAGCSDRQLATRRSIATALKAVLVHDYSVAPSDLQAAHTAIAIHSPAGSRKIENAIALFDTIDGGLRLSAPLYSEFDNILGRLALAADLAGQEALVGQAELARLSAWFSSLTSCQPPRESELELGDQWLIYAPGSRVMIKIRGQWLERELCEPQLVEIGEEVQLMYRYNAGDGAAGWVTADRITPSGNEWQRAMWDPASNNIARLEMTT